MTQTGSASLVSGLLSLLATKVIAVTLGPTQVAILTSLQQARLAGVTASTLNGQTALVREASSADSGHRNDFLRTASLLIVGSSAVVAGVAVLAPAWIARQAGLSAEQTPLLLWLIPAVLASAAYVFLSALLNASGAIRSLARLQVIAPVTMLGLSYPVALAVSSGSEVWLTLMLGGSSAAAVGAAAWELRRVSPNAFSWTSTNGRWWSRTAAKRFFAISSSMFASGLFSTWVVMAIRGGILRSDGLATGGLFDAAWSISMNQAGLVLASLQTYYLPVLARTSDAEERSAHIGRVLTVTALAAAALIALTVALKPIILTGLYSSEFVGASRYLRWTLAGDYLKITSWILSIPLVARAQMTAFLMADVGAYLTFTGSAIGLTRWMTAAESAAVAFVLMYAVHLLTCGTILWLRQEFRPDLRTASAWLSGGFVVVGASALFWGQS